MVISIAVQVSYPLDEVENSEYCQAVLEVRTPS